MHILRNISLLGAAAILSACSTTSDPQTSESLGSNGGTVSHDHASVSVPAGALEDNVEVKIAESDVDVAAPAGFELVGPAIAFTPHGTLFTKSVTLTLPYTSSSDALSVLRLDDEEDTTWEIVPAGSFDNGKATVKVRSFSIYAVAAGLQSDSGKPPSDDAALPGTVDASPGTTDAGAVETDAALATADASDSLADASESLVDAAPQTQDAAASSDAKAPAADATVPVSGDGQYFSCDVMSDQVGLTHLCSDSFYPANILELLGPNYVPPCQGTVVDSCDTTGAVVGCRHTDVDDIPGVTLTWWYYDGEIADYQNGVLCGEDNSTLVDVP